MKDKIQKIAKALNLSNELNTLLSNNDIQLLSENFDKDKDIICFVRVRNKAEINYPNKQEIPLNIGGFVLAYSSKFVSDFALKHNLTLEIISKDNSIIAVAKLTKKTEIIVNLNLETVSNDEVVQESKPKKKVILNRR